MKRIHIILGVVIFLSLLLLPTFLPRYYLGLATQILIYAIFAMSLDILVGYTGLPSLGHAAYFGVAGYAAALISLHLTENFIVVLLSALITAGVIGALFGLLAVRTRGAYFLMITLALGQVLWGIAFKWRSLTGGDDGLPGIPRPEIAFMGSLWETTTFYLFIVSVFLVALALLYLLVHSLLGLALRGIRESETRMAALGYNAWLFQYLAFVLSALFAGLAGILFTLYNGFVSPADLSLATSAKVLLMVILGGAGTLHGPILGAGAIVLFENLISAWTERWALVLGTLYVVVVMLAPQGLVGLLRGRRGTPAAR